MRAAGDNPLLGLRGVSGRAKGRLSLILHSGAFDRLHYGLALASAALAIGRPATLFFTMDALAALKKDGWAEMRTASGQPADRFDANLKSRGVGDFETLLEACRELGAHFILCEAGLRAMGLCRADLRPDLDLVVAGAVTFLNEAEADGQALMI